MISIVLTDSIGCKWSFWQNKAKIITIKRGKRVMNCICSDHIYSKNESVKLLINSIRKTNNMLSRKENIICR